MNDRTNASHNAITVVAAGPWSHHADADSGISTTGTRNPTTRSQTRTDQRSPTPRTVERTGS
jgi:hypothetical protein